MQTFSAALIIPVAHRDAIRALGASLGWGWENYTVPLANDDTSAPSHYGCRADVTEGFLAMVAEARATDTVGGAPLPPEWLEALDHLIISIHPDPAIPIEDRPSYRTDAEHFWATCAAAGLVASS